MPVYVLFTSTKQGNCSRHTFRIRAPSIPTHPLLLLFFSSPFIFSLYASHACDNGHPIWSFQTVINKEDLAAVRYFIASTKLPWLFITNYTDQR